MPLSVTAPVTVWTVPIRIAHWSVAALVIFDLFFSDTSSKTHRVVGYVAAGIVVLRTLYGVLQRGRPAGIHVPTLSSLVQHARSMRAGNPSRPAGHNPLGAAMSLILWLLILLLAVSGWISRWDRFWGEDWPIDIHNGLTVALQICLLLHLLGIAISSVVERQNLALAMITGRKTVD
jgi:cytochrome b